MAGRNLRWLAVSGALPLLAWTFGNACSEEAPCEGPGCTAGSGGEAPAIDCPPSGVLHGPWSLAMTETSITLRWDACAPSSAEVRVEPEDGGEATMVSGTQTATEVRASYDVISSVEPDLPGTYYLTEALVEGLEAGRCYRYELAADAARGGRFCSARPAGASFQFFAVGDTNPTIGNGAGVLEHALSMQADFSLHLGDIQYYASVFESWTVWFPQMQPLLSQGAFMPSVGNHEHEIEFEFEDYYVRLFGGAGFDSPAVEYYRFQSGGLWFFSLDTEQDLDAGSVQASWLETQLADAAAQPGYRGAVVYFHRPMMTLSEYAQKLSERLHFAPIFAAHGVKLVMSGHVHGYERFVDGELTYLVSGGGGAVLHDLDASIDERPEEAALRVASAASHHGMAFEVTASELRGSAVSDSGEVLDSFAIALP